jgi:hypothetical protein
MNRVFVSAGTPADQRQADFRDAIINVLELAGLSPRLMTASDWDYKNPLRGVRRAMQGCCGVVVIAYAAEESKRTRHQVPAEITLFQVFAALPWYEAVAFTATLLGLNLQQNYDLWHVSQESQEWKTVETIAV